MQVGLLCGPQKEGDDLSWLSGVGRAFGVAVPQLSLLSLSPFAAYWAIVGIAGIMTFFAYAEYVSILVARRRHADGIEQCPLAYSSQPILTVAHQPPGEVGFDLVVGAVENDPVGFTLVYVLERDRADPFHQAQAEHPGELAEPDTS